MGIFHSFQGIVNDQFSQILNIKSTKGPECVVQLVDTYFAEMEKLLSQLSSHKYKPVPA